jgi:hypothetical protein
MATFPQELSQLGPSDPFSMVMQFFSFLYNPQMPALFFPISANVNVPAGVTTVVATTDPLTLGKSMRTYAAGPDPQVPQPWFQMNIGVVSLIMGAAAGDVEAFIGGAGCAQATVPAGGLATLTVLNFGTAPDGALLNSDLQLFSSAACTVVDRGSVSGAFATYIFQIAQWR